MNDSYSNKLITRTAVIFLCLAIHVPAVADEAPRGNLVHVVFMWFKDGATAAQRRQVIEVTRSFEAIPGVLDIRVGEPVAGGGGTIDNTFSVGLYIVLEDESALEGFLNHPIHQAAIESGLPAGLERMVRYDFLDNRQPGK